MEILIYGAGQDGNKLLQSLECYKDIEAGGFIDAVKEGCIRGIPIMKLSGIPEQQKNNPVVIAVGNFNEKRKIYRKLKSLGFSEIYLYLKKDYCHSHNFFDGECVLLNNISENSLFYAEMSIIDFCNLNCKGCNHYSPIFERKYPDVNARIKDVEMIAGLYDDVVEFGLIGGEPLLSPDIEEYVRQTRKLLGKTRIQMVTNGLLIPRMDKKILECISENNITIAVSQYVPTLKIIDKIRNRLEEYGIDYVLKPARSKEKFYKTLSLKKDSIYERKCISDSCVNICDGKIAKCPSVLYIEELNRQFGTQFPEEGIYKLSDFSDGHEINAAIEKTIPLCGHCVDYQIDWEPCGSEKKLEDFVVLE